MKLLLLNAVIIAANEKGEEKVKRALGGNVKKDEGELPRSWYTDQNLRPPADAEDDIEPDEDGMVVLEEDEFDYDFVHYVLPINKFISCKDNEKIGCVIITTDGDEWVEETAEEIYAYITVLTRPWYTVLGDNIIYYLNFFRRKTNKKSKSIFNKRLT